MKVLLFVAVWSFCSCQLVLNPGNPHQDDAMERGLYDEMKLVKCELQRIRKELDEAKESLNKRIDEEVLEAKQFFTGKLDELGTDVIQLKTEKDSKQKSVFSAYTTNDGLGDNSYQNMDRIIFKSTWINQGGYYNNSNGEYICPVTGMYFFSFLIYGYKIEDGWMNSQLRVTLVKEGEALGEAYASNSNTKPIYVTLSHSLVVACTVGEKVWLESRGDNNQISESFTRNTFSGFLITADWEG